MNLPSALRTRPWMQRLGVRLASLMALALLPLGIVAYLQTSNLAREAQSRTEAALMGESLRAASGEIRVISQARGLVAGLAPTVPELLDDNAACSALMARAATSSPEISLVSFVPANGLMTCSSNGQTYDYSGFELFETITAYREPAFTMSRDGPVSGGSVMGVIQPVFDAQGDYLGYVGAWLPHDRLRVLTDAVGKAGRDDVLFWTLNQSGEVLTASMGLDRIAGKLPASSMLADLPSMGAQVFTARSVANVETTYAVLPLVRGQLYLVSSWANRSTGIPAPFGLGATWFPVLMWVAGLGMSIWAAEILVVRHVRALNRAIASFAHGGRHHAELELRNAPLELTEMAEAYASMTDDIMRNEASLEDEVHQKEVLLREVHHRVKNNLQLIASIMNMQIRQAKSPEAKGLLKGLQERIMSLATIHRGLYQTTGLSDIHAQELLSDITRQSVNIATGPGRAIEVETDFDDIRLTPDQAVPLSLLLTEAVTNAIKYARAKPGVQPKLSVSMKAQPGGMAVLDVRNTVFDGPPPPPDPGTSTGLGAQLMMAFAQQIGGKMTQEKTDDCYCMQVVFAVTDLMQGENRLAADADSAV
jgi:two-component sensor histidine kinase